MENDFFLNAGIAPPLQFESTSSPMPTWQSLSSAMEIQGTELNCPSHHQSQDCFFNPTWEHPIEHQGLRFDSGLGSTVSSPSASNSNIKIDSLVIRELIGKLGNTDSSGEISPHSHQPLLGSAASYIGGANNCKSTNTSCYNNTPLNSPPKLNVPVMKRLGKPIPLNSSVAEFSADPGFAERAAKFSCFGSRSFNGRTGTQFGLKSNEFRNRSSPLMGNGRVTRVSSSPSLKELGGSQMGVQENKTCAFQNRMELTNDYSQEESTVSEQNPNGKSSPIDLNSRKRKASPKAKTKETPASSPSANPPKGAETNEDSNAKRCKTNEGNIGNVNEHVKTEEEQKGVNSKAGEEKQNNGSSKPPEPPKDYIHVRARRGQATDSHSLAERVRREKISERMKLLQDLVPGCNKVTGKALMLDEIINYVQSLQRQVEFLSMKLASVNTRLDFNVESLMSKEILQSNNSVSHPIFPLDSSASAFYGQHQNQHNPAIQNQISNGFVSTHSTVDPLDSSLCQNLLMQLPPLNGFSEGVSQFPTFCEDDLHSIVQM